MHAVLNSSHLRRTGKLESCRAMLIYGVKVAIEARALTSSTTAGVKTYARELIKNLREIGGVDYEIIQDNPPAWKLLWWMNVTLPDRLARSKADVVHFTKGAVPMRKVLPIVVTIHDIIPVFFPASQAPLQRLLWPRTLKAAAQRSDHIITISEASKRDIMEQFGVEASKITVTPEAVDTQRFYPRILHPRGVRNDSSGVAERGSEPATTPNLRPQQSRGRQGYGRQAGEPARPYILFVGTRDMRKNVPLLIHAFARIAKDIPHQVVIAGRQALKGGDDRRQAHKLGLEKRITWLDFVPEQDLPALYAGADLFVWPSAYEGWGLPPMEAMASGVPVIVSNGGALPEVVGSAGEIVPFTEDTLRKRTQDSAFEEELAARMLDVLEDERKRRAMRELGLERVRQFSWRRVAEQTLEVYRKVMSNK